MRETLDRVFLPTPRLSLPQDGKDSATPAKVWRFAMTEHMHTLSLTFLSSHRKGKRYDKGGYRKCSLLLKFSIPPRVVMERNNNVLQEMAKYKSNKIN